jgi:hypothetical protein
VNKKKKINYWDNTPYCRYTTKGVNPLLSLNMASLSHDFDAAAKDAACQETLSNTILMDTLIGLVLVLALAIVTVVWLAIVYQKRWWSSMVQKAFNAVDTDGSGRIGEHELYAAVLQLYTRLPVRCTPPSKLTVNVLLCQLDQDGSGDLDFEEFDEVMAALSAQATVRIMLTVVFTAISPILSGIVYALGLNHPDTIDMLPAWTRCAGHYIEATLGMRSALTVLFLLLKFPALDLADYVIQCTTEFCLTHSTKASNL